MMNPTIRTTDVSRSGSSASVSDVQVERTIRGSKIMCREWGKPGNPVLIGIHGLTSNSLCFADSAEAAARAGFHVIVPDLRGRNLSPPTGAGSYGWPNHAKDIVAIADAVGAKTVNVIGHSMGGLVAMDLAAIAAGRLGRIILLDSLGPAEFGAVQSIGGAVNRLGKTYPSADAYVATMKHKGVIHPWTATWDRHYREELEIVPGGVRPRTDKAAVDEDTYYAMARASNPLSFRAGWTLLPTKTLVIRAGVPLAAYFGNFISESDARAYKAMRGDALFKTVDANHYSVLTHHDTSSLVVKFLKDKAL